MKCDSFPLYIHFTYADFPASRIFFDFFKAAASVLAGATLLLVLSGSSCLAARSFSSSSSLSSTNIHQHIFITPLLAVQSKQCMVNVLKFHTPEDMLGCMQPRKIQCCHMKCQFIPRLLVSLFYGFFVSKVNLYTFYLLRTNIWDSALRTKPAQ